MAVNLPEKFNLYLVGGAVRDEVLGLVSKDRDFMVTGATPEEMTELGFRQVGKDFPVFLHPESGDEYALARTERKSGAGYGGFVTDFSPEISVEQDLARRDLTINAIAKDAQGQLIDPFNGLEDLKNGCLRHVTPAFAEDPLRVLRVARFAARFPEFSIAAETLELMRSITASGELQALKPERIWLEIEKNFQESRPDIFFEVLRKVDAHRILFPELAAMINIPQRADYHAEGDVWIHTLLVLRKATELAGQYQLDSNERTAVLSAALWHDVGKAVTPRHLLFNEDGSMLGKHHGHEDKEVVLPILDKVFSRLKPPKQVMNLVRDVATEHLRVHRIREGKPSKLVQFFEDNSFHNKGGKQYLKLMGLACKADSLGRLLTIEGKIIPAPTEYPQLENLLNDYDAIRSVNLKDWIIEFTEKHDEKPSADQIREEKRRREIAAIKKIRTES